MKNGAAVAAFEAAFAEYVGAKYCIALCNGTATLHTALVALGVEAVEIESQEMNGDVFIDRPRVAVPPLTMSATTIAVLHAGAVPVFVDVDPDTWLMDRDMIRTVGPAACMPVSLYGLHYGMAPHGRTVDDAAQTLRPHDGRMGTAFTSYSFQASKILPLGEGGILATNDEALATRAREFSSLGYRMRADQPRIDPAVLKSPTFERHHTLGWNYRMADSVARQALQVGWEMPRDADDAAVEWDGCKTVRLACAALYRDAIAGCSWIRPQHVPEGWGHDYWSFAVALEHADLWHPFVEAIERHGGERPYAAWRLTYQEPAFEHLVPYHEIYRDGKLSELSTYPIGLCPVAEDLQPRLVQFQTNDLASAQRNADAVALAIKEIG